jgi:hypothetical protein
MISPDKDAHALARKYFTAILAFTAAGVSGVHIVIRKGQVTARIGLPITAVKNFFADRDRPEEGRLKPLLHLMMPHRRYMADGRIIPVGEHLRGERIFDWRGYRVNVGVPGVHYPSLEGIKAGLYTSEGEMPPEKTVPITYVVPMHEKLVWHGERTRFRRGTPNITYNAPSLPPSVTDKK